MTELSRRGLFRGAAVLAATPLVGLATETLGTRMAFADSSSYPGDVLVVLSLRGGFDGLSAVVPAGDPDYYTARPGIGVPQSALLPVDGMWGLHPALAPLQPLWAAGQFGAVVAAGQANPTRSHFEASAEMERAAPASSLRTGWLDRALGLRSVGTVFQAVQTGGSSPGQQFAGLTPELSLGALDEFALDAAGGDDPAWVAQEAKRWDLALRRLHAKAPTPLLAPATAALAALSKARELQAQSYPATYDEKSDLAKALRDVARLVKAGVGLQVAAVDYGSFDMHAGLGGPDSGWMHDNLSELATALAAFAADLGPLFGKVTVVTMSEFGRRVGENASGGVDHGHGNTMLLLGGGVVGGQVHGSWPGLAPAALDDGDVAGTTDYRVVLSELLRKRCGQTGIDKVFPGLPAGELGVARPWLGST
ncbi:MAG: hypothetical protein JWN87_1511 [Frankiales bacterium]|nr:hypothetical protein [Frankiales bacterium]